MTIEQRRQRAAGNAKALSCGRNRQAQGIEAQFLDDLAGMRRVVRLPNSVLPESGWQMASNSLSAATAC